MEKITEHEQKIEKMNDWCHDHFRRISEAFFKHRLRLNFPARMCSKYPAASSSIRCGYRCAKEAAPTPLNS